MINMKSAYSGIYFTDYTNLITAASRIMQDIYPAPHSPPLQAPPQTPPTNSPSADSLGHFTIKRQLVNHDKI